MVRTHAQTDGKTKFKTYLQINPRLEQSPFLNSHSTSVIDISKFRLGSHHLPIETGRWSRKERKDRLCRLCGVIGDEEHVLFVCSMVNRSNLCIPNTIGLDDIWKSKDIFELFKRIKCATEYL